MAEGGVAAEIKYLMRDTLAFLPLLSRDVFFERINMPEVKLIRNPEVGEAAMATGLGKRRSSEFGGQQCPTWEGRVRVR